MKVIRQLLIAWMLVAFLVFHGFGQDDNNFSWSDFTYNSPEEKAFWDKLPDWSYKILVRGWKSQWWLPQPDGFRRNAQGETIESNSTKGFNGYVKYKHSFWNLRTVFQFVDGYAVREKSWFQSGQKESETNFKEGEMHGVHTAWYKNGQKREERTYKDGKLDGPETSWFENGQKQKERNYKNNNQDWLETWWYDNGQKRLEGKWKNRKNDGLHTEWYKDGQQKQELHYKDGKLSYAKVWLPDGKECPESKVIDGKGTLVTYSLEGKEISRRDIKPRIVIPARKSRTITIPPRNPLPIPIPKRPASSEANSSKPPPPPPPPPPPVRK